MVQQLDWAQCREQTAMGWLESSWRRNGDTLTWTVEVPPGAQVQLAPPGRVVVVRMLESAAAPGNDPVPSLTLSAGRYEISVTLQSAASGG